MARVDLSHRCDSGGRHIDADAESGRASCGRPDDAEDIVVRAQDHHVSGSDARPPQPAAKHGVAGLTKTIALEVATAGVTVNCISPGYVWTPLVEKQIPDTMKARGLTREQVIKDVMLEAQPTKEFVTVEEVAAIAVFLCSDAAKSITGANLSVDGGWTAA